MSLTAASQSPALGLKNAYPQFAAANSAPATPASSIGLSSGANANAANNSAGGAPAQGQGLNNASIMGMLQSILSILSTLLSSMQGNLAGTSPAPQSPNVGGSSPATGQSPSAGEASPSVGQSPSAGGASPSVGQSPSAGGASPSTGQSPSAEGASPSVGQSPSAGGASPSAGQSPGNTGATATPTSAGQATGSCDCNPIGGASGTSPEGQKPGKGEKSPEGQKPGKDEKSPEGQKPGKGEKSPEGQKPGKDEKSPEGQKPGKGEKSGEGKKPSKGEKSDKGQKPHCGKESNDNDSVINELPGSNVSDAEKKKIESSYHKIPKGLRKAAEAKGAGIDLVTGSICNDPKISKMANQTTWDGTRSYKDLPGVGGGNGNTIIVADKLSSKYHGSADLVLHEHGHTIDSHLGNLHSKSDWQSIYNKNKSNSGYLDNYSRGNAEEAFGESFTRYCKSKESRAQLPQDVQQYFSKLEEKYA